MKIVVQVKLLASPEQAAALATTLHAVNDAACWVSAVAFDTGVKREFALRKHTYQQLKDRGLGAQAAQHVIKRVCDAYTSLRANIGAGNLGKPGSKRRDKAEGKPIVFRPDAAHPFDDRCLSWQHDAQTVSIWTTSGRMKNLRYVGSAAQLKVLGDHRKGETDLVCDTRRWETQTAPPAPVLRRRPPGQRRQTHTAASRRPLEMGRTSSPPRSPGCKPCHTTLPAP